MSPIRIVLGEDHALVREGTRRILEQDPELSVVGEAGDGERVLELIGTLRPDIAILDIKMPTLSGIDVVRRMHDRSPRTRALILSAYDDDELVAAPMDAGASGFLLKTARPAELLDAVRRICAGEVVLHPVIAAKIARLWSRHHDDASRAPLSPRELEVLELAASGLRNQAIAERLSISRRTVEGHFNGILGKLGVSSRLEAVLYAMSQGWLRSPGRGPE